jgi:hypothetical protein
MSAHAAVSPQIRTVTARGPGTLASAMVRCYLSQRSRFLGRDTAPPYERSQTARYRSRSASLAGRPAAVRRAPGVGAVLSNSKPLP